MARRPSEDDDHDEIPPLSSEQLAKLRPAREVLSPDEFAAVSAVRKRGRPVAIMKKVPVTMRLDPEVLQALKATGKNWQTRANATLAERFGPVVRVNGKVVKRTPKAKLRNLRKEPEPVERGNEKVA